MLPVVEIPKVKDFKDGPKTTQQGLKLFAAKQRPPGLAPSRLPSLQRSTFRGVGSRGMNHHVQRGKSTTVLLHSSSRNGTFSNPPRAASPRNWTLLLVFCYDHVGVMCLVWVLVGAGC